MAEKEKMENLYRTPLPGGAPRSIYEVAKVLGRSQEKVSVQLKEQGVQILCYYLILFFPSLSLSHPKESLDHSRVGPCYWRAIIVLD